MKKLFSSLIEKKGVQALLLFLPFTGMINPVWYTILFLLYFFIGAWYFMLYEG